MKHLEQSEGKKQKFMPVPTVLMESPVWILLTNAERVVLMEFLFTWMAGTHGDYQTPFSAPYDSFSTGSKLTGKAIKKLIGFGVIERVKVGGLYKNYSLYKLKPRWWEYEPNKSERKEISRFKQKRQARSKRNRERREPAEDIPF
jgi:hypothetical protein